MNAKALKTLVILTLLAVLAAVGVNKFKEAKSAEVTDTDSTGPLFPQLRERINEITEVAVRNNKESFSLTREGDVWGMPSRGGYPVDFGQVKKLALSIAELKKIEPKTKNSALYEKLGVQEVTENDAPATKVTLKAGDEVLAAVILGNIHARRSNSGKPSLYVREVDQAQSWQVEGRVVPETTPANWLEKQILEVGRERVATVTTTHPDGEVLVVKKAQPEDEQWEVMDVPGDRELSWDGVAGSIAGAIARLNMQDVQSANDIDFGMADNTLTEFTTWDGLRVTMRIMDLEENSYIKIESLFDPSLRPADQAGPAAPENGEGGEAEGANTPPPAPELMAEAEVENQAAELNKMHRGWVYVVPGYTASNFKKRVSDLLKPLPDPNAETTTDPLGSAAGLGGDGAAPSLEELFPDGLPEELQGIDFGDSTGLQDDASILEGLGVDKVEEAASDVIEGVKDGASEVIEEVKDGASDALEKAKDGAAESLKDLGKGGGDGER